LKYRPEIDGLRALAVIPVILFHAGFELFSGGFVGVDVFFVISGYLITTILIEDIENKRFSLVNFYERRAKRILPALFFVIFVCIPFAWMWMLPSQMKDFSQSLVAVSLFASNILFWLESGYFDAAAEEKPLLHTWSLAVEEQYYLLFPIFLILTWRFGKNKVFWMIVVLAAISLLLSEWSWRNHPTANFYLAPTRVWELFSGSFAAFVVQKHGVRKNNFLALLGLSAIIFSILVYDKNTPFPSLYALVPVIGVVLLILFAEKKTSAAKFLSTKAMIGLGLISYSAYLWHQPVFAFARIRASEHPSNLLMLALSFFSIILAYFSWRYVEKPFRNRLFGIKKIFFITFLVLSFFFVFGLVGSKSNGFGDRFIKKLSGDVGHEEFHQYLDANYFYCELPEPYKWDKKFCRQSKSGSPDWILLGDSHAKHYFIGFANTIQTLNIAFYINTKGVPYASNPNFSEIFEVLERSSPKIIFLTMHFSVRVQRSSELYSGFSSTIKKLKNMGHEIVLLGDVPRFNANSDTENCVYTDKPAHCTLSVHDYRAQKSIYDNTLRRLAKDFKIHYLETDTALCSDIACSMVRADTILYRDVSHLNIPGSIFIGEQLKSKLHGFVNK
jgi:peptidoglycan/LPS O-acetylase OafA/YrhL